MANRLASGGRKVVMRERSEVLTERVTISLGEGGAGKGGEVTHR